MKSVKAGRVYRRTLGVSYFPEFLVSITYVLEPTFAMYPSSRSVALRWPALTIPRSTVAAPLSPLQKLPELREVPSA